jgi:DNA-binding Xre family transcriptional regulator
MAPGSLSLARLAALPRGAALRRRDAPRWRRDPFPSLAIKELVAYKLLELIRQKHMTKDALAKRMKTSRASLDRLLDPNNPSVTLSTLSKAAAALGCSLRVEFSEENKS